jgi:ubiquinol-cytochrome c reductase iron-sulfur subunit
VLRLLFQHGAGRGQKVEKVWMADHAVVADGEVDLSRRKFLTRAVIATGAVGAVFAAVPFIESWSPSERARAQGAPTDFDLSKLDPGMMATPVWRRQPIYVVRRTPDMVARIAGHDGDLKDPNSEASNQPAYAKNAQRSRTPEFLVVIGICTHLGCLPKQRFEKGELYPSWPGGFFCPCHGSRFDLAGRVFDGSPASINLNIPPYSYPTPTLLRIGADEKGTS